MATLDDVLDDLVAEQATLAALLAGLTPAQWDLPTPAPGWTVRDQVAHLAFGEELATLAATDPDAFARELAALLADLDRAEREPAARARRLAPGEVLGWWRGAAAATVEAVRSGGPDRRIPWVTGAMRPASFATARLMETWAHGHDVAEAVGVDQPPTSRLRHVADLGVRTRGHSYRNRGLEPPPDDVRVELLAPDGDALAWGPVDAADLVRGSLEDFCLVVTRRRHAVDTGLTASGPHAAEWLQIAQCFAGPPSDGPSPRAGGGPAE